MHLVIQGAAVEPTVQSNSGAIPLPVSRLILAVLTSYLYFTEKCYGWAMRRTATIIFQTAAVLFVLALIVYVSEPSIPKAFDVVLIPLLYLPYVLVVLLVLGLVLRLFVPAIPQTTPDTAATSLKAGGDFRFWYNANLIGLVFWCMAWIATSQVFDGGDSFWAYTILYSHILALPIALICLFLAYKKRDTDIARSVALLKIPFFFGAAVIAIIIGSSLFES